MAKTDHGRLTLRAIEVFVAAVEEGSLAAGAKRLGASPSSVSQQITNLEAALGAKLVDRAARPLALTPAGYVFQRRALAILDEAARAQTELAELELTSLPQLRLAVIEDFDANVTPALVSHLAERLPGCDIATHSGLSHENFVALESRAVDLVVAAEIEAPPDWIEQHLLLRDPYVLITARGLLDEGHDLVTQLMAAPMVRYDATQFMGRQIEIHLRRLRLAPPRRFVFDSTHSVMAMVEMTRGWALATPLSYLRAPRFHSALDLRPLPFKGFSRTICLYARRGVLGDLPSRAARETRNLIAAHCLHQAQQTAPWLAGQFRLLGEEPAAAESNLRIVEPEPDRYG